MHMHEIMDPVSAALRLTMLPFSLNVIKIEPFDVGKPDETNCQRSSNVLGNLPPSLSPSPPRTNVSVEEPKSDETNYQRSSNVLGNLPPSLSPSPPRTSMSVEVNTTTTGLEAVEPVIVQPFTVEVYSVDVEEPAVSSPEVNQPTSLAALTGTEVSPAGREGELGRAEEGDHHDSTHVPDSVSDAGEEEDDVRRNNTGEEGGQGEPMDVDEQPSQVQSDETGHTELNGEGSAGNSKVLEGEQDRQEDMDTSSVTNQVPTFHDTSSLAVTGSHCQPQPGLHQNDAQREDTDSDFFYRSDSQEEHPPSLKLLRLDSPSPTPSSSLLLTQTDRHSQQSSEHHQVESQLAEHSHPHVSTRKEEKERIGPGSDVRKESECGNSDGEVKSSLACSLFKSPREFEQVLESSCWAHAYDKGQSSQSAAASEQEESNRGETASQSQGFEYKGDDDKVILDQLGTVEIDVVGMSSCDEMEVVGTSSAGVQEQSGENSAGSIGLQPQATRKGESPRAEPASNSDVIIAGSKTQPTHKDGATSVSNHTKNSSKDRGESVYVPTCACSVDDPLPHAHSAQLLSVLL